jgi:hypothetical protein
MRTPKILSSLGLGLALAGIGCQDLDVTNPADPDRGRTVAQPASLESLVASTFGTWWEWVHDTYPVWVMSTMADEFTAGFGDFGILVASSEPRVAYNNSPLSADNAVNEDPWYGLYGSLFGANDGLRAIDAGAAINTLGTDAASVARATDRTRAMAKLMQGLSHGYLALYFDQAYVVGEGVKPDTLTTPGTVGIKLAPSPYRAVMDTALAELAEASRIADGPTTFTLPAGGWLYQAMDDKYLARLAHSYRARLMAQVARTRSERDAVDWAAVVAQVDSGITTDFSPIAVPGVFFDDFKRVAGRASATIPGNFARVDYMTVGPADSTNGFVNWLARPVAERQSFQMRTRDRRIQPASGPAGSGKYFGYTTTNRFAASRGTYHQSRYYYLRAGTGESWQNGPQLELTRAEMDLLKAEALIRLGRASDAVPLINKTRVANGELPPVTVDGPPDEPGCVPRKASGACGSLWDALRYEKRIEGAGVHPPGAFLDARGWQSLPAGTPVQLPMPGRELQTLLQPLYTFGGGGAGSAPTPEPERCPVALARCP